MHLKNRLPFVFFVSLVLTLFLGIFLAYPDISAAGEIAVVKVDVANIRTGPGTDNSVFSQVGLAERLPVLGKSGDWCQVRISDGSTGWVAGWLVALETTGTTPEPSRSGEDSGSLKTAVVTGSVVNIRSGPGTSNGVIGQVNQGNTLSILEQSGDWYRVKLSSGSTGWVAGWLVSVRSAPAQTSPPVNQDTGGKTPGDNSGKADNQSGKALSLNVSDSGGKTSATLKASAPFNYSSFFLNNPDRLVVDMQGVTPGDLPLNTTVDSKSVSQVRVGYFQKNPDVTRLVFELKGGAQYLASLSTDQKTLTVETYIPNVSGSYRGKIITIDPGHGGSDPGAIGAGGTKEKEVTLDIANRIARILEANGAKVVMARSGDTDDDLYERTDKANNAKSDVFVSIHINANNDKSIGGTTTYIYSGTGARVQESDRLARCVQAEMIKTLGLRDIGVKSANFAVLRTSNMPAILVEVAFISNAAEEKLMRTDSFRSKAAEAIARGIGLYFAQRRTA
ncbi:MAG: N-acetylmuramoyl-L-alanine amidase LytC precursor [Pelotomaculum sp. PtaB.Bin013]|uniref:N-acetylmuramoyl-L-alanine amidase n=1 Tax=Pelotomaculum isophthalicicum JI TaxID=947010 RepID=A0A9X4H4G7_9FIRM|nr:N-acetylmuramoyl-L-alanine amidase [Pelotomaculum isophthalicicum]MDF9409796.1 N-acetylmuramoyl-L-alanine amidase [Pelotomaculum isophthalicicum JI]OPX83648.1 MAG: N-acetylmuramoyl-L-alanine amidase LytC precursor [Pelotomaculum sp. PtaB.Bin013]